MQVLSNHVVLGAWDAAALLADIQGAGPGGLALPTLGGARLLLTTDGLSIFILPEGSSAVTAPAVVEEADFLACGGVLHVIDSVLVEGSEPVDGAPRGIIPVLAHHDVAGSPKFDDGACCTWRTTAQSPMLLVLLLSVRAVAVVKCVVSHVGRNHARRLYPLCLRNSLGLHVVVDTRGAGLMRLPRHRSTWDLSLKLC